MKLKATVGNRIGHRFAAGYSLAAKKVVRGTANLPPRPAPGDSSPPSGSASHGPIVRPTRFA